MASSEDALAAALADFDAGEEEAAPAAATPAPRPPPAAAAEQPQLGEDDLLAEALADYDADADARPADPGPDAVAAVLAACEAHAPALAPAPAAASHDQLEADAEALARQLMDSLNMGGDAADGGSVEETLASLARSAEGLNAQAGPGDPNDEALSELIKQLGGMVGADGAVGAPPAAGGGAPSSAAGGEDDKALDGLLDNLVGQLLSKDVMLEPMQHLHAEFPRFLAEKGPSLPADDLARYRKQQQIVSEIVAAYSAAGSDGGTERVAELMQQMQQCGPPPAEIAGASGPDAGCLIS